MVYRGADASASAYRRREGALTFALLPLTGRTRALNGRRAEAVHWPKVCERAAAQANVGCLRADVRGRASRRSRQEREKLGDERSEIRQPVRLALQDQDGEIEGGQALLETRGSGRR